MAHAVEPNSTAFPELDEFLDGLPDRHGALIPTLHKAQQIYGYLPREIQLYIAQKLQLPAAKVFGVTTFYSFFTMTKKGVLPVLYLAQAIFLTNLKKN
jgi:NADH-quinone oxidoreductase subunit E/NADP-reducing hydrogenase subunit HndA